MLEMILVDLFCMITLYELCFIIYLLCKKITKQKMINQ